MGSSPRWKVAWLQTQEFVAMRVLRMTKGTQFDLVPPDQLVRALKRSGLRVRVHQIDRRHLHPHLMIVASRRGSDAGIDRTNERYSSC